MLSWQTQTAGGNRRHRLRDLCGHRAQPLVWGTGMCAVRTFHTRHHNFFHIMAVDLYEILEVESSASTSEIKRAYRKLALRYHPDKVSEEERQEAETKFKEISHAYETLIDDDKRLNYDMYGTADGAGSGMGGYDSNPFGNGHAGAEYGTDDFYNFFNNMNSHGGHAPRQEALRRTEDAHMNIDVTLAELYVGKVVKITSTRNIVCTGCHGSGARKRAVAKTCAECQGQGYTTKIKRVGPGLASQFHVDCETCGGTGKVLRTKDKCKMCRGAKVEEETKILEFEIVPGARSGDSIVLKGEADQYPGKQTGDVVLTIHCKDHDKFVRKDDDLYVKYKIPLVEALAGFSKVIATHLDGRGIHVTTPTGKVIRPGDYLKIKGEGMPVKPKSTWFGSGPKKGDLYVEVDIEFPNDNWYLEKNDLIKLKNLLPTDLKDRAGARKQKVAADAVPEANIEYVSDFTIARSEALPDYECDKPEPEPQYQQYQGMPEDVPECATQ